jgi:hypothetical protein
MNKAQEKLETWGEILRKVRIQTAMAEQTVPQRSRH